MVDVTQEELIALLLRVEGGPPRQPRHQHPMASQPRSPAAMTPAGGDNMPCAVIPPAEALSKWPRWLHFYFGPDSYFLDGRITLQITIMPWPKAEQEVGALVRSLAHIEISWVPRRGLTFFRYSPNRAAYFLRGQAQ